MKVTRFTFLESTYLGCFTDLSYFDKNRGLPGFAVDTSSPCQYCKENFLPGNGGFQLGDGSSAACHCPLNGFYDAVNKWV